jgi:alpha-L-rhamnosidase
MHCKMKQMESDAHHLRLQTNESEEWETSGSLAIYDPQIKCSEFNIAPAKWIWIPSERTLPCTFVLFRKEFWIDEIEEVPLFATGWIAADSRYLLYINGERIQFGPAPHDPRHAEADPIKVYNLLRPGLNVIAVQVLFYGQGDGTWPTGKPGLICRLNAGKHVIASDDTWLCNFDPSHLPGQAKRWYLRALQEVCLANELSSEWRRPDYQIQSGWYKAIELEIPSSQSAFSQSRESYNEDEICVNPEQTTLTARKIPMVQEELVDANLCSIHQIFWNGNPADWFRFRTPVGFTTNLISDHDLNFHNNYAENCHFLITYELPNEMVGFPWFNANSSSSIAVDFIFNESRKEGQIFLDNHFYSWSTFYTSTQRSRYETFDYECTKFLQLHVTLPPGSTFSLFKVGIRERSLLPKSGHLCDTSDQNIRRLLAASHNTLLNSAIETIVDGMARERQQYSGDCSHQLHAVRLAFGEWSLSRRFLEQYGYGQMLNGVWFDSWPGYDRYARLAQRQIGASGWGSLVDHSMGFVIDHVNHWLETGEREPFEKNEEKIRKFEDYLNTITALDGLLKVEDIGSEAVWIDHDAYKSQSHKRLAFNLYYLQMRVMLAWIRGEEPSESFLIDSIKRVFFDPRVGTLRANNFEPKSSSVRYCDRSLSHLIWLSKHGIHLVDDLSKTIELLTKTPSSVGISYPANSIWRHWAWASLGRVDLILEEYRKRWLTMHSVIHNGTIQEMWISHPGTKSLMSHCAVSPTIVFETVILGVSFDPAGGIHIRPQLGDLKHVEIRCFTPQGSIHLSVKGRSQNYLTATISVNHEIIIHTTKKINKTSVAFNNEFVTKIDPNPHFKFKVYPYPQNELISEVST